MILKTTVCIFTALAWWHFSILTLAATRNDELQDLLAQAKRESERAKANLPRGVRMTGEYADIDDIDGRKFQGDIVIVPSSNATTTIDGLVVALDTVRDKNKLWKDGHVPYVIYPKFSQNQVKILQHAIQDFETKTCLKFIAKTDDDVDFVMFRPHVVECSSPPGNIHNGKQWVSYAPACFEKYGSILHEIMHAIGFYHEQMRLDRDNYINILFDNILESKKPNFDKQRAEDIDDLGLPYDLGSLMHYGPTGFTKDDKLKSFTVIGSLPPSVKEVGQRDFFSELDLKKINTLYNCSEKLGPTSPTSQPTNGSDKKPEQISEGSKCTADEIPCAKPTSGTVGCGKPCDGIAQCADESDENPDYAKCPRPICRNTNMWACPTVKCIPQSWVCDGSRDCLDGADERPENCKSKKCEDQTEFGCGGKCIKAFRVCDGVQDCINSEDEDEKMCNEKRAKDEEARKKAAQQQQQQQQEEEGQRQREEEERRQREQQPEPTSSTTEGTNTFPGNGNVGGGNNNNGGWPDSTGTENGNGGNGNFNSNNNNGGGGNWPGAGNAGGGGGTNGNWQPGSFGGGHFPGGGGSWNVGGGGGFGGRPRWPSQQPSRPPQTRPHQQQHQQNPWNPFSPSFTISGSLWGGNYNPCPQNENSRYSSSFGLGLQFFGKPACINYGLYNDPTTDNNSGRKPQRHCFLNLPSLSDRREIRVTPEAISKLLQIDNETGDSPCTAIALGYATLDTTTNASTVKISLPNNASSTLIPVLQRAREQNKIDGYVIVIENDNTLRALGSDVVRAQQFAQALRTQLRTWNATGVILQWLRPRPADKAALNTLLKTLAEAMQYDPALASATASGGVRLLVGLNVLPQLEAAHDKELVLANVDFLNVLPDPLESLHADNTYYANEMLHNLNKTIFPDDNSDSASTWLTALHNDTLKRLNVGVRFAPTTWTLSEFQMEVAGTVQKPGINGPLSGTAGMLNVGELLCVVGDAKRLSKDHPGSRALRELKFFNATQADGGGEAKNDEAYAASAPDRQWIAYETPQTLLAKLNAATKALQSMNGVYVMDMQNDDVTGLCGVGTEFTLTKALFTYADELEAKILNLSPASSSSNGAKKE